MKTKLSIISVMFTFLSITGFRLFAQTSDAKAFSVNVVGKGEPMLFIPGLTCSAQVWDETIARYSKNHQCHVFTLAGYAGQAPAADTLYLETFKNAIVKYIKDKKLDNVILVGHSIGGFLSLRIATELHQHLKKAIIVDALPFYAGLMNPNAKVGFDSEMAKNSLAALSKMDDKQLRINQLNTAKFLCADSTKWELIANWGAKSDRKTMTYSMYEMLGNDIRNDISAINIPVLVMAAFAPVPSYPAFTKAYVLSSYRQQYAACKSCTVEVTQSSKHFIMYDAPEWLFSQIDSFIQ